MDFTILSICVAFIGLTALIYAIFSPKDTAFSNKLFVYSSLVFILLCVLFYGFSNRYGAGVWRYFLDLRYAEFNHSATFSALLLFLGGMGLLGLGLFSPKMSLWHRLYYFLLSACFVFLAADEYYLIHETIPQWERYYVPVAVAVSLLGMLVFWKARPPHAILIYFALFGGLAVSALGGIVLEEFRGDNCFGLVVATDCIDLPVLEEILEMIGYTMAVAAILLLAQQVQNETYSRFLRFVSFSSFLWLAYIVFNFWLQPAIENRFFAESLRVQYGDSNMVLTGYRLNQDAFRAGESFDIDLFWHLRSDAGQNYGYTVNLLDPITGESILRENRIISYPPTRGWFPRITYRTRLNAIIPDSIETPISPILTVAVWKRSGSSFREFLPEESSRGFFAEEFPILTTLAFLSPETEKVPVAYRFENGILLGEPIFTAIDSRHYNLELDWSAERDIEQNLAYFIHFLNENGQDHLIFDRPPFENRFLTRAWMQGMNEHEKITLEIPPDANGRYQVFMGLLQSDTVERIPLSDSEGNTLLNAMLPLGDVEISAD